MPCASAHTLMMRFALDLVMMDRAGRVLDVQPQVSPWRIVVPTGRTFALLDVPSRPGGLGVEPGGLLRLAGTAPDQPRPPKAVSTWCDGA